RLAVRILLATALGITVGESLVLAAFADTANKFEDEQRIKTSEIELCKTEDRLSQYRPTLKPESMCAGLLASAQQVGSNTTVTTLPDTTTTTPAGVSTDDVNRLKTLDDQITFYSDLNQCELYPERFSPERIAEL